MDVAVSFPEEVRYVIETLEKVDRNDEIAQERSLSPAERLAFHQAESAPMMKRLQPWLAEQLERKKVEPNSGLGKAIACTQRHWEALPLFLRVESVLQINVGDLRANPQLWMPWNYTERLSPKSP